MYEPNQVDIEDKASELLEAHFADDDYLIDALISALPTLRAVLKASPDDVLDARFDLVKALHKHAKFYKDFEAEARDFLIGQVGYTVQTAVDDFKFVQHETRC